MVFPVAIVVGLIFGGADQYVGSLDARGLWTVSLSLLSAPWLVLPFLFGCSQLRASRAGKLGLVATMAALCGYFCMIIGPLEGGQWSVNLREIHGLLASNAENIVGGLVTGPLYGLLGQRWRTRRAWLSAVLVAGALCLEPVALTIAHRSYPGDSVVWPFEVFVGIAVAAYFYLDGLAFRRRVGSELREPTTI
ncbi:MAG: hypothetical protein ABSG36_13040 [Acidimicrobiales bacterium]